MGAGFPTLNVPAGGVPVRRQLRWAPRNYAASPENAAQTCFLPDFTGVELRLDCWIGSVQELLFILMFAVISSVSCHTMFPVELQVACLLLWPGCKTVLCGSTVQELPEHPRMLFWINHFDSHKASFLASSQYLHLDRSSFESPFPTQLMGYLDPIQVKSVCFPSPSKKGKHPHHVRRLPTPATSFRGLWPKGHKLRT